MLATRRLPMLPTLTEMWAESVNSPRASTMSMSLNLLLNLKLTIWGSCAGAFSVRLSTSARAKVYLCPDLVRMLTWLLLLVWVRMYSLGNAFTLPSLMHRYTISPLTGSHALLSATGSAGSFERSASLKMMFEPPSEGALLSFHKAMKPLLPKSFQQLLAVWG